jgi:hypothetical protein
MNAPFKPAIEPATTFVRRHIGPSPRDGDAGYRGRQKPRCADGRDTTVAERMRSRPERLRSGTRDKESPLDDAEMKKTIEHFVDLYDRG